MKMQTKKLRIAGLCALGTRLLLGANLSAAEAGDNKSMIIYRINCGSEEEYVDANGSLWLADQELADGKTWGAVGGGTIGRAVKTIPGTPSPGVYRSERFNADRYEFKVDEGTYTVRLHFAETYHGNSEPGRRVFDIAVNGKAIKGFDPFADAGGFSRPAVKRLSGIAPDKGTITIQLGKGIINGIEILKHDQAPAPTVKRLLFMGNSYTLYWDLPGSIARMVNTGECDLTVECDQSIMPGRGLADHWKRGEAAKAIKTGNYDYVVLQEYSRWDDEAYAQTLQPARNFNELIRAAGGKTLLYCTWARAVPVAESAREQERITEGHNRLARELDATVIPAGPAWQAAKEQDPGLDIMLYADPTCHPTLYSAYLSACVFYGALTGCSAEGHPLATIGAQQHPIEPDIARFLQRIAWETLQAHLPGTAL